MKKRKKAKKPSKSKKNLKAPAALKLNQVIIPLSLALMCFLSVLSAFLPKDQFQLAKEKLVKNPQDIEAHLALAEEYLNNNQYPKAESALLKVDKLQNSQPAKSKVLGQQTVSKIALLWQRKNQADPQNLRFQINQWEKTMARQPDYRDGYLQLALLHYRLWENQKAREYLNKAIQLDPNFEAAGKLKEILR